MVKKKKMKAPKIGAKIYVGSSFSISHGSDDFAGGKCTISSVQYSEGLKEGHVNYCFVGIKERPGHSYNYGVLLEEQAELKKEYGNQVGHTDPDIDTPWIEDGDLIDGKEYHGPDIW